MDWVRMIQNAINYIEKHLFDDINQDEIAKNSYSSVFQFNRAFSMIAGVSMGEYIRNRKLSLAAKEIRESKEKIIDIALKYGYDSPESFTKAFIRFHGESPSKMRLSSAKIRFYNPLTIQINVKGGFNMTRKLLTDIRDLIDGMQGHNYALPDCIKYIFERIGVYDYLNYWDIAAVTGDTIAHVYNHNLSTGCEYCVSGYLAGKEYISYVFGAFGYTHEYFSAEQITADKIKVQQKVVEYIDKGIPVLVKTNKNDILPWKTDVGTYCIIIGYENEGNIVKLLVTEKVVIDYEIGDNNILDLIFVGEKQKELTLTDIYTTAINKMTYWLTLPSRSGMYFGAEALLKWADDIEAGRFAEDGMNLWDNYGVYVCNIATNGGEPTYLFKKLADLNPKYEILVSIGEKIQELLPAETPTGGKSLFWVKLEELKAGMNMKTVAITMRDTEKRFKVSETLRDYAKRFEQVVELLNEIPEI